MKHIYLYTTKTYQEKSWYKIGQTDYDPVKRVQHQDNSSNPEPLILIAHWTVNNKVSDKKVHHQLEQLGFEKLRGNREWFELSDLPIQDVESALHILDSEVKEESNIPAFMPAPLNYTEIWWGCGLPSPI